jgi:hypothetical protein
MRYSLHKQASASLKSGLDLKEIVKLPSNEDEDDWIAVHGENDKNICCSYRIFRERKQNETMHCGRIQK